MKRTVISTLTLAAVLGFTSLAVAGDGKDCAHDGKAKGASSKHASHASIDKIMAEKAAHGWLGFEASKNEATGAVTVVKVAPGSPASQAGFREGDELVALNGIALTAENKDQLKKAKAGLAVGKQVNYTVRRAGNERQLTATLGAVPQSVLAEWRSNIEKEQAVQMAQAGN
jgi:S1-C subfamily serine protease